MPRPGMCWRHVTLNVKYRWLPGDPRGFRSRKHRIHSSGDYHNPPPEDEHKGLFKYNQERAGAPRKLPVRIRERIGCAIVAKLKQLGYRVLVESVSSDHVHLLVEVPINLAKVKRIIGQCKGFASYQVREELPGQIWSEGGSYKLVKNRGHQERAFHYIRDGQAEGAWTWTFDGSHAL